jgi:hypothetical protein
VAKSSGLGDNLYVDGFDLSGDIGSIGGATSPIETLDFTGIDKSAFERQHGKRGGELTFTSFFNPSAGQSHQVLKNPPSTNSILSYARGTAIGNAAASLVAKRVSYDMNRNEDGSLLFVTNAASNLYGVEWGSQLTAGKRTDGSATNGASLDLGAASPGAFGGQMWVHLFAFTGTSVTIKVQESSDDAVGDPFADVVGATSGALTAVGAMRIATAAINIERYLRVVTTGTFSNAVFFVQFLRNDELPVF